MRSAPRFCLVLLAVSGTVRAASPVVTPRETFPYQLLDGGPLPSGAFTLPLPGRNDAFVDPLGIGALTGVQAAVMPFAGPDSGTVQLVAGPVDDFIVSATPVQERGGATVFWLGTSVEFLRWNPTSTQFLDTALSSVQVAPFIDATGELRVMRWTISGGAAVELDSISAASGGGYLTPYLSSMRVVPGSDFSRLYHVSGTDQVYSLALGSSTAYAGDFSNPDAGMVAAGTYPDFSAAGIYDSPGSPYLVTVDSNGIVTVTSLAPTGLGLQGSFTVNIDGGPCACSIRGVFPLHAPFEGYPSGALVLTQIVTPRAPTALGAVIDWQDVAALLGLGIDVDAGPFGLVDPLVPVSSGGGGDGGGSGGTGGGTTPGSAPGPFVKTAASSGCSAAGQASAGAWVVCALALGLGARGRLRRRGPSGGRPGPAPFPGSRS